MCKLSTLSIDSCHLIEACHCVTFTELAQRAHNEDVVSEPSLCQVVIIMVMLMMMMMIPIIIIIITSILSNLAKGRISTCHPLQL